MKRDLIFIVFIAGLVLTLAIIGTALGLIIFGRAVPETLSSWANLAMGFVFGAMGSLIKLWSETEIKSDGNSK